MKKSIRIQFHSYDMIERFSRDIADLKGEFDLQSGFVQTGSIKRGFR